ncbi:MAG TPA: hypothetical protein VIK28_07030, partial [Sedimentisphaerales bacterium]
VQPTPPPTTIQPTVSHSDETIRIARAELERDTYKQAWQESQRSVDTIKWAFTFALSAIGIILVLFAYVAYKETKRHEKAVAEAEQAAKDAKKWEQDAKIILANVDTQATGTLDKIREEGKKQIREMLTEAETQRNVSKLWSDALRLSNEGKYEEACNKWRQIIDLKPDPGIYGVYLNLCTTLATWAERDKNDRLFDEARSIYDKLKALASAHKDEPIIRYCQAEAGFNLVTSYVESGKTEEARSIYDEIKSLAATFNGEPTIRENQAMAGTNLVRMYGKVGNLDDAHNIYKELKSLAEKYKDEPTIQEFQARAGVTLIAAYVKAEKIPEVKAMLIEVEPLVKKLPNGEKRQKCIDLIAVFRLKLGIQ